MTSTTSPVFAATSETSSPPVRGAGWAALAQGLLIFVPIGVLGAAINWPASLSDAASIALPRLAEHEGAVRLGYVAYLLYSVLFAVTIVLLARLVEGELATGVRRLVVGFAIASSIARSIGIVRWLGPMPDLATSYTSATDDGRRYAVARIYDAVNAFGGIIGEALGVGLFAALAVGLLAVGLLRSRRLPRWIGIWAVVSAAAVLVNALELFGVDLGPVLTVTVTIVQLWFLATGAWLLTRGPSRFGA